MPLIKSASREAVGENIKREVSAGNPRRQAIAIALDVQRRAQKRKYGGRAGYADGGEIDPLTGAVSPSPYAQEKFGRIADAVGSGLRNWVETPGRAMREGITTEDAVNWAAPTAVGMVGSPGVPIGALGSSARLSRGALPMDEASRMARARQMGFSVDEPLYHGGGSSFRAFDLGKAGTASGSRGQAAAFFTPESQVADYYSKIASVREPRAGEVPHDSFDHAGTIYQNVYDGAQVYPAFVNPGKQKTIEIPYYNTAKVDAEVQKARKEGYDTLRIKGMADTGAVEASRADQIAVLSPANIRSRFAAFDPNKANLSDLLAGVTAVPAAGVLASQSEKSGMKRGGAIAVARRINKAAGGAIDMPFAARAGARNLERSGFNASKVGGRTDALPTSVRSGAYVIPADIPSGLGKGNSLAGANGLNQLFKMGPYGASMPHPHAGGMKIPTAGMMKGRKGFADGGDVGEPVDVLTSGGEFIVPVEKVAEIGGGDVDHGHAVLDALVKQIRQQTIKTLRSLPGPKKS